MLCYPSIDRIAVIVSVALNTHSNPTVASWKYQCEENWVFWRQVISYKSEAGACKVSEHILPLRSWHQNSGPAFLVTQPPCRVWVTWGIPIPKIQFTHSDLRTAGHWEISQKMFDEIIFVSSQTWLLLLQFDCLKKMLVTLVTNKKIQKTLRNIFMLSYWRSWRRWTELITSNMGVSSALTLLSIVNTIFLFLNHYRLTDYV